MAVFDQFHQLNDAYLGISSELAEGAARAFYCILTSDII
jgi:hypothetical protein